MRTIIAGGRDFLPSALWLARVAFALHQLGTTVVISGTCRGADKFGEAIAEFLGIPVEQFPPDWDGFGKTGGPIRNAQMVEHADSLVLLPGGRGTDSMRACARSASASFRTIDMSNHETGKIMDLWITA